jgi:hypothetical protein
MTDAEQLVAPPFNFVRYKSFANRPKRTVGRYFDWLTKELDQGRTPDVGEHTFYVTEYANLLVRRLIDGRDYDSFISQLDALKAAYESVRTHTYRFPLDGALVTGRWDDAWSAPGSRSTNLVRTVGRHLGSQRLNGWDTFNLANRGGGTRWALQKFDTWLAAIEEVTDQIQAQSGMNWVDALGSEWEPKLGSIDERMADLFFDEFDLATDHDHRLRYRLRDLEYQSIILSWDGRADYLAFRRVVTDQEAGSEGVVVEMVGTTQWIESAVEAKARWICREAENLTRQRAGVPVVGDGWVAESELFKLISDCFPEVRVQKHARPVWLTPQHLDVFLPEFNIAIEFQGEQHFKPIEFFGGEAGFARTVERDEMKRILCQAHECLLIEVRKGYDGLALIERIREEIVARGGEVP